MTPHQHLAALLRRIDAILAADAADPDRRASVAGNQTKTDWLAWTIEQQRDELRALRLELVALRESPRALLELAVDLVLTKGGQ